MISTHVIKFAFALGNTFHLFIFAVDSLSLEIYKCFQGRAIRCCAIGEASQRNIKFEHRYHKM